MPSVDKKQKNFVNMSDVVKTFCEYQKQFEKIKFRKFINFLHASKIILLSYPFIYWQFSTIIK